MGITDSASATKFSKATAAAQRTSALLCLSDLTRSITVSPTASPKKKSPQSLFPNGGPQPHLDRGKFLVQVSLHPGEHFLFLEFLSKGTTQAPPPPSAG